MKDSQSYPGSYPHNWQPVLLHQYLLQQAKISPETIAIISDSDRWNYQDLYKYSYHYADILDNCGLAHGDRIVLELEPSPQAIALIIASSLLGLVFVPVSPETPSQRLEQILLTTEAKLHIKASSNKKNLCSSLNFLQGFLDGNCLQIIDKLPRELLARKSTVLESDLAYIIFTSGTTGNPKGIMMTHRAIIAFFRALVNYCQLTSPIRVGTISPLQFDFSLLDMGLALGSGVTLVQIPRKLTLIPQKLLNYLDVHQVEQFNCVPSVWKILLHYASEKIAILKHLKTTLFAGETFPVPDIIRLQSLLPQLRIINCFGQSESIACSLTDIPNPLPENTKTLSIGFAHPGAEMMLLDEQQQEINEANKIGEIYLRGANLFSGYWRNPEATIKALIPNPFNPLLGEKIFRTGDLGYKGFSGELYLSGRRDLQVKIRGNRVELEEIERKLIEHPQINQSVVTLIEVKNITRLAAFVVLKQESSLTSQEICLFCGQTLPKYMIPEQVYFLDKFPLTVNGKIDRKGLLQVTSLK